MDMHRGVWTTLLLAGCIRSTIEPGVIVPITAPDERRDPDPTADVTKQETGNGSGQEAPYPAGSHADKVARAAATVAAFAAGAIPGIIWSGTFDENLLFERKKQRR